MYALINTMTAIDVYIGRVLSLHRTAEAAEVADRKLQRATKRANSQSSYLPTVIRQLNRKSYVGDMIKRADLA